MCPNTSNDDDEDGGYVVHAGDDNDDDDDGDEGAFQSCKYNFVCEFTDNFIDFINPIKAMFQIIALNCVFLIASTV